MHSVGLSRIFILSLVRYLRYFLGCPPMLYLQFIAFCVDCPVHLSTEGTSVVNTDSEGRTVFLGRRTVLPFLGVSSPDCNQNRTGLVTAGRQRMRVVAGSEGATNEIDARLSSLYFTVLQRFYVVMRL